MSTRQKYTHAWMAFKAIERLENVDLSAANKRYAAGLIKWFKNHRDGVIQGAWYPDMVIKDMASSHILKMKPSDNETNKFKYLPTTYLIYRRGKKSQLRKRSFSVNKNNNLPDRCESIAHSVIDNLKMQETELKGSPLFRRPIIMWRPCYSCSVTMWRMLICHFTVTAAAFRKATICTVI